MSGGDISASAPPVLDGAALARWDGMGKGLGLKLIDLFLAGAPARLEACRFRGGDFQAVEMGAHTLKSSAGNLGAKRLQALCESLEAAAGGKREADTARLSRELEGVLALTVEELRREREEREA